MSWNLHLIEDPYKSKTYVATLRQFVVAMLGQLSVSDARGFVKRSETGVVWAIETSETGSRDVKRKHRRAAYELCVAPDGKLTSGITAPECHVEHPYTQKVTRDLLIQGYLDAHTAMRSGRLTLAQCAEALMTIMDARRGTVLMPAQYQNHFRPSNTPGDGLQARYSNCTVTYRTGGFVNSQQEDDRVNSEVQRAVQYLQTGTGSLAWPWQGATAPRSVAALSKPYGTIAQPKTSNAATTLQRVTWADFDLALTRLGLKPEEPTSKSDRWMSWSLRGQRVFSFVQPHRRTRPTGDVYTAGRVKVKITALDGAGLQRIVDEYVQPAPAVVY